MHSKHLQKTNIAGYMYVYVIINFITCNTVQNNKFDTGIEFMLQQPIIIFITEDIVKVSIDAF